MQIPQRIKPVRSLLPVVIFGGAAVFLGVASEALSWSAASTVTVGAALAVLLAVLGPPVLMLPGEIAEDRRLAASAGAKLSRELAEAIARSEQLYKDCGRLKSCLDEARAEYDLRLEKERRRLAEQLVADRSEFEERLAKSEAETSRLRRIAETQMLEARPVARWDPIWVRGIGQGPPRQKMRFHVLEHVHVGSALRRHVGANAPEIAVTSLEKIESVLGKSNVVGPDALVHTLPGPEIAGIQTLGVEPGGVKELDDLADRTNEVTLGG